MIKGIDLSKHNGAVDFNKVKASGVEFVILRAGFGKSTEDVNFRKYIKEAKRVGLKIGVYWFIYAKTSLDIAYNVKMCDAVIKNYKNDITMGVWADFEGDSDKYASRQLSKLERSAWVKMFMDALIGKGYDAGYYANPDYIKNKFVKMDNYKLWLAWYTDKTDEVNNYKPYMWQYTNAGKVSGIKTLVDLDYLIEEKHAPTVVTNGSPLMLRTEPSTKGAIITKIPNGAKVEIINKPVKNWYFIAFGGFQGYASAKYIKEV